VFRTAEGRVATRSTEREGASFLVRQWLRELGSPRFEPRGTPQSWTTLDPTAHPTYAVSVERGPGAEPVWSDLHLSELDVGSAEPRVVLTVQRAIWDEQQRLRGVARVGLLTTDLDAITEPTPTAGSEPAAPRIVLLAVSARSAAPARLVTRVSPEDGVASIDGELRIEPHAPPPEVAALLDSPLVRQLDPECPRAEGALSVHGERWLATLSPLSIASGGTAGWLVAVLVPEAAYTGELLELGRVLTLVFGGTLLLVLGIVGTLLWTVRRGLLRVGHTAARMRDFDFAAGEQRSGLRDIDELLGSLERAKTVARALCKYLPVPLVQRLYERNRDPELGGEPCEVTLLFTDIQGFTALSERLPPAELARALGRYFQVLTAALEAHGATIDKYIGDALMAFWNAPVPLEQHSQAACRGVLAAQKALLDLYASPEWQGLPPLVTRFGLHRTTALVGHFGAPSRLAYTALGDGVNLTARLESLCKQYGVTVLVSADVVQHAAELGFRHVDRVVVQGKRQAVDVYELLPERAAQSALVQAYESALGAYLRREFAAARALLVGLAHRDGPSRALLVRCERFEREPPPAEWTGAFVAEGK
jgi:adenylate cyclase